MKAMALNQVQDTQATAVATQVMNAIGKAVENYGKNDSAVMFVAIVCAVVVLLGVAMMSASVMIAGVTVLILALTPTILRWLREDSHCEY